MKTIKVSEATGPALDWLVAKCEGEDYLPEVSYDGIGNEYPATRYSTDWAQGGPIIGREQIGLISPMNKLSMFWIADIGYESKYTQFDHDPLIAAMRCYCCSKLGAVADIPEELCQQQKS